MILPLYSGYVYMLTYDGAQDLSHQGLVIEKLMTERFYCTSSLPLPVDWKSCHFDIRVLGKSSV